MSTGHICHVGHDRGGETGPIQKYAERFGLGYRYVPIRSDMFQAAEAVKTAKMVVIWNGNRFSAPLVEKICLQRRIPHIFMEWGMLPQSDTFFIDPRGFCGDSVLDKDLSWVNEDDLALLHAERKRLQSEYTLRDEGFILVPLQIHNDSQVLYHTPWNTMEEMVEYIEYLFPNRRIVARPHPKGGKNRKFSKAECIYEGTFFDWAQKASLIVGATSTCLYEAGIMGKPVLAIGNHPLRGRRSDEIDRILAGALALRIKRESGDFYDILERFRVRPNP